MTAIAYPSTSFFFQGLTTMLTRFGWGSERNGEHPRSPHRPRHLRLETLEQRTVLTGAVVIDLNGIIAPGDDGWSEGESLVIAAVTVTEDGIDKTSTGIPGIGFTYTIADLFNSLEVNVAPGSNPNLTVDWTSFLGEGINNGTSPIEVTVVAYDALNPSVPLWTDTESFVLLNAAPTITSDSATVEGGDGCGGGSNSVTLVATAGDPGPADVVTMMVDWDTADLDSPPVPFDGSEQHTYAEPGTYIITLMATDDDFFDPKTADASYEVTVGSGGPVSGPSVCFDSETGLITVTGETTADNNVLITAEDGGLIRVAADFLPGPDQFLDFAAASVMQILAFLGDGDDVFAVASGVNVPVVVSGGAGDDVLAGGPGRSILIGGAGSDILYGGGGEDLLIGGTTDYDTNSAALLSILAEWTSGHTLEQRVRNIVDGSGTPGGGANGTYHLTDGAGGTVHDDGATDGLLGGAGTDWLFLNGTLERLLAFGSANDLIGDDLESLFD